MSLFHQEVLPVQIGRNPSDVQFRQTTSLDRAQQVRGVDVDASGTSGGAAPELSGYLSQASGDIEGVRQLGARWIEGLSGREHTQMQKGFRALSGGENLGKLLEERPEIREKVQKFVDESKNKGGIGGILGGIAIQPGQPTEGPAQKFLDRFDSWDTNRDGGLDREELGRALQDPSLNDEYAAAFAVIYERVTSPRRDPSNPANNEPDLMADGRLTKDEVRSIRGREDSYRRTLEKLQKSPTEAFVGPPDGDSVRQGRHGSCAFLAAIIAQAENDPASIQRMIASNPDGSWTVTFPGQDPVQVRLSRAEIALGASTGSQNGNNGLWVAILEKAYAIVQSGGASNPLSIYEDGEPIDRTTQVVSGENSTSIALGDQVNLRDLKARIERALLDGRPITASLHQDNPYNLPDGHAYSVLNLRGDNITLRNPWGDNRSGEGNTNDGQVDGRLTLPLSDFARYFRSITV